MDLAAKINKKSLGWLFGTLLLGALGSGLWEAALKPSMLWFGTLMLDLATLGLASLRDGMYLDVAKGTYERAGVSLLSMATGLIAGFLTAPLIAAGVLRNKDADGQPVSRIRNILRANWMLVAVPLAFAMIFFVNLYRITYIVRASNHADQMLRITAPYVSNEQRLLQHSKLAQVRNRDDYVRLLTELNTIAETNVAAVPEFTIY